MVQLQSLNYLKHKSYDQTHAEPLAFGSNLVKSSNQIKHTMLCPLFLTGQAGLMVFKILATV